MNGGKWDNCNSIINKYIKKKDVITSTKRIAHVSQTGGVSWVLFHKPKGHWFYSQSGHVPGLQVHADQGPYGRQPIDLSLSLFLPPFPSKIKKKKKEEEVEAAHIREVSQQHLIIIFFIPKQCSGGLTPYIFTVCM